MYPVLLQGGTGYMFFADCAKGLADTGFLYQNLGLSLPAGRAIMLNGYSGILMKRERKDARGS